MSLGPWARRRAAPLLPVLLLLLSVALPAAPAVAQGNVVREGLLRGQQLRVVDSGGGVLRAELVGSGPVADPGALAAFDTRPFATGAPAPSPLASRPGWKLRVVAPGIQIVGAAALAAAGLNLASLNAASLRLRHLGEEVALEEVRDAAGTLAELRFFAEPGDRWSAESVYWLTVEAGPGLRMLRTPAPFQGARVLTVATEQGLWRANQVYDSRLPGADGDHFFSADLRPFADSPAGAVITATIAPRLPPAGPPMITLTGATAESGSFTLCLRAGAPPAAQGYTPCADAAQPERPAAWLGPGTWEVSATLPLLAPAAPQLAVFNLSAERVHLDAAAWSLPVRLELGGRGARFFGEAGRAAYRLAGLPQGAAAYDLGDPLRPVRLLFGGDTFEVEAAVPRPYLVTGEGTLNRPAVAAHVPVDLARPLDAEALYIMPAAFEVAVAPLLAHRRAQGLRVAAVTTEAIYDAWGHGQPGPEAIRSFLRYAAERWAVAPTSLTLVGDGTSDPRNYLGRDNIDWVPPYLAMVDPWLGETACESCYAQLHGDDPLADTLPDLAIGRIPAKSPAEASALAQKILRYERSGAWRNTIAYVADNADLGGNFADFVEASAALQPPAVRVQRLVYDPGAPQGDPVRERDPLRALARTMGAFDGGAAIVAYVGHGNQFQWGYTGPPLHPGEPTDRQHLLGVFRVDELDNGAALPVVLSLSCLTGSFQIPAFSGTSIDERLVARPDGGAIAAWSSAGLGVLYGHDALQRGFFRALWAAPGQAHLGRLTMAGTLELFATKECCQATLRSYLLLGDPLTVPRLRADLRLTHLPLAAR